MKQQHRNKELHFFSVYETTGESNGKLPLRTCPGCSVPEPYRSPEWVLVPARHLTGFWFLPRLAQGLNINSK